MPPLTPARWLTAWSLDLPVLIALVALGLAYLALASRTPWPRRSTACFLLLGLPLPALATMSFLGTYDEVLLWPLAVQDVLLLTLVPLGLTFGRPLALIRTAFPGRSGGLGLVGRVVGFPLVGSVAATAVLTAIYTTGWDQARLDSPWLLQLTRLLLVVIGCAFLWPLLGVDEWSSGTSPGFRALVAFVDGLLDAVPGLAVLATGHVIAAAHYARVGRVPGQDQQIGGTAMVALSELVGLPAIVVVVAQWMRSDAQQARRVDDQLDATQLTAGDDGALERPWWESDPGPLGERLAQRRRQP